MRARSSRNSGSSIRVKSASSSLMVRPGRTVGHGRPLARPLSTVRFRPTTLRCQIRRRLDVFIGVRTTLQAIGGMGTLGIMAPNAALQQARLALRLSQDEVALA